MSWPISDFRYWSTLPSYSQAGVMNQTAAVQLTGVHKDFRDAKGGVVHAVDGINLTIQPGEIVAFLGPNGAGKTTTLDMVLGLSEPTSGSVRTLGLKPREAILQGRAGAMLQSGGLLRDLSVQETVDMIASTYRGKRIDRDGILKRAGLEHIASRKVSKCSGGEQQRLRFALALIPDPELLVLDEPTAGMDVAARHEFWQAMQAEAIHGRAVVFATHYLQEAEDFAARTILMAAGQIIVDGPTEQVRQHAGGRLLSAALPAEHLEAVVTGLRDRFPNAQVDIKQDRLEIRGDDTDAIARHLLTETTATDLIITRPSLDEAFVTMTQADRMQGEQK